MRREGGLIHDGKIRDENEVGKRGGGMIMREGKVEDWFSQRKCRRNDVAETTM